MRIAIAADHVGVILKEVISRWLKERGMEVLDFGTDSPSPVDYPDYGKKVALAVSQGEVERGVLICGTGIGMDIVANKFPGVRAALCMDPLTARISRQHNDANILVLGGRILEEKRALEIVDLWFSTGFEGGRHQRRLDRIREIEEEIHQKGGGHGRAGGEGP